MLRRLLEERFKLAAHRESKEMPIFALVVGKNGPKLKAAEPDPMAPPKETPVPGSKPAVEGWFLMNRPGHVEGHGMNMASLVNVLGSLLGRPVADRTGLKGNYDFDLDFTPDEMQRPPVPGGGEGSVPTASAPNGVASSLLSAVQSQLGLKLENTRGPVEQIVVDHVEKVPTEN